MYRITKKNMEKCLTVTFMALLGNYDITDRPLPKWLNLIF